MVEDKSGSERIEKCPIYYCEKYALKPNSEDEDKIKINKFDDEPNIREVIPFPKTADAKDLLMGAPSELPEKQLAEAHIKISKK